MLQMEKWLPFCTHRNFLRLKWGVCQYWRIFIKYKEKRKSDSIPGGNVKETHLNANKCFDHNDSDWTLKQWKSCWLKNKLMIHSLDENGG